MMEQVEAQPFMHRTLLLSINNGNQTSPAQLGGEVSVTDMIGIGTKHDHGYKNRDGSRVKKSSQRPIGEETVFFLAEKCVSVPNLLF